MIKGCFTSGQAYVALSRARSMLGLQIKNFHSKNVTADPLVKAFYDALDNHEMRNFLEEQAGALIILFVSKTRIYSPSSLFYII